MKSNPIGIFDSGVGGTSIWREIIALLPDEDTIYLSDSINAPYGTKSKEEILSFSIKNTELLIEKGAKIIVVACNTATTNTISYLRDKYDIPFIGIEPAIKPASIKTISKCIGILATKGTLSSALFSESMQRFTQGVKVIEQEGTGIVELIESGNIDSQEMDELLHRYIDPMVNQNIDYLVLGCTHYPYLIPQLKRLLPQNVTIIDSGFAVAKQTKAILEKFDLLNTDNKKSSKYFFYINQQKEALETILSNVKTKFTIEELKF